jgi:hypothetical protein
MADKPTLHIFLGHHDQDFIQKSGVREFLDQVGVEARTHALFTTPTRRIRARLPEGAYCLVAAPSFTEMVRQLQKNLTVITVGAGTNLLEATRTMTQAMAARDQELASRLSTYTATAG